MHSDNLTVVHLEVLIDDICRITDIPNDEVRENILSEIEDNDISIHGLEYGLIYFSAIQEMYDSVEPITQDVKIKKALELLSSDYDSFTLIAISD